MTCYIRECLNILSLWDKIEFLKNEAPFKGLNIGWMK